MTVHCELMKVHCPFLTRLGAVALRAVSTVLAGPDEAKPGLTGLGGCLIVTP